MPRARYDHSCGLVSHPQHGPEVVVAGGYSLGYSDTVDIYTVDTDSWRQGKVNIIDLQIYVTTYSYKVTHHLDSYVLDMSFGCSPSLLEQ